MTSPNGGPAHPVPEIMDGRGAVRQAAMTGLTLRDYFAAKALQALTPSSGKIVWSTLAAEAYAAADAMLAQR